MHPAVVEFVADYVVATLGRAGQTLLSLSLSLRCPTCRFRSIMPEIIRQVAEAYGADPEELRLATPSASAISEMDEVLN
ncbi:hypothetical protein Acid7E03_28180 [Acidisoma sp. 7E03]